MHAGHLANPIGMCVTLAWLARLPCSAPIGPLPSWIWPRWLCAIAKGTSAGAAGWLVLPPGAGPAWQTLGDRQAFLACQPCAARPSCGVADACGVAAGPLRGPGDACDISEYLCPGRRREQHGKLGFRVRVPCCTQPRAHATTPQLRAQVCPPTQVACTHCHHCHFLVTPSCFRLISISAIGSCILAHGCARVN